MSSTTDTVHNNSDKTGKFSLPEFNRRWLIIGILCWLVLVISQFPASWAAYFISRVAPVGFTQVSGTLWSGRASLASVKYKDIDYSLGQLTWKLDLLSLVKLNPCAQVTTQMDKQEFDGRICFGAKGAVSVKNATASFPAGLLQSMLPIAVDGQVSANIDLLELRGDVLGNLRAKIGWMNAKVNNGFNWMSLGTLGIDAVDDKQNGINAHVIDVQSPLHVDLVVALYAPRGGKISGNLRMSQNFVREAKADAWIAMLGSQSAPDAEGNLSYNIDFKL